MALLLSQNHMQVIDEVEARRVDGLMQVGVYHAIRGPFSVGQTAHLCKCISCCSQQCVSSACDFVNTRVYHVQFYTIF